MKTAKDILKICESTNADCHFWKATDGKWYYSIAYISDEDAEEWEYDPPSFAGPFSSEDEAEKHLNRNHANPGGWSTDDSGKQPPPKGAKK